MASWCQKILLGLILLTNYSLCAAQQWQHEQLWEMVKKIDAEESEDTNKLLETLDGYTKYARSKNWQDIEVLVMSKKASVHSMLQQFESVKEIVDKYLPLAEQQQNMNAKLLFLQVLLQYHDSQLDLENAIKVRENYKANALAFNDQRLIVSMHIQLALSKYTFGDMAASLVNLQTAVKISEKINYPQGKGAALNSIAILYDKDKDYKKALEYYEKSVEIYQTDGTSFSLSVLYFNMGQSYFTLKDIASAKENLILALTMSRELKDEVGEAFALNYLGQVAIEEVDYENAYSHFTKALEVFKRYENTRLHFTTSLHFAELQAKMGNVDQAMALLHSLEAQAKAFNIPSYLLDYYTKVYELEKLRKNFSSSLSALENSKIVLKKINEKEKKDSLQELLVKFNTKQKEADNRLLQQQNKLKQLQLNEQSAQRTIFVLVIVFSLFCLLIISFLLYKQIINRNNFKHMALRDVLTGAPNRRAIITIAERRFKQCIEEGAMLTIAMLDIDHFKKFNDNYGHDIGDKVLRIFSDACQTSLRNHDRYGRYGGEEWLLVLLDAQEDDVTVVFNRLRERLKEAMLAEGQDMSLTFSLGATQLIKGDKNLNQLIKRADENLYKAKNSGRDQYVVCD
jgi:diguanylate cyclase (GGDEF)-like protein